MACVGQAASIVQPGCSSQKCSGPELAPRKHGSPRPEAGLRRLPAEPITQRTRNLVRGAPGRHAQQGVRGLGLRSRLRRNAAIRGQRERTRDTRYPARDGVLKLFVAYPMANAKSTPAGRSPAARDGLGMKANTRRSPDLTHVRENSGARQSSWNGCLMRPCPLRRNVYTVISVQNDLN